MDKTLLDTSWIWHPDWVDSAQGSAGGFVNFRKSVHVETLPTHPVLIQVSADTKYKLYVNGNLASSGPVKGDEHLWFFDEVDIQPHLRPGANRVAIRVLRFFHATSYATSFPRMAIPGLFVRSTDQTIRNTLGLQSDDTWETSLDTSTVLRIDQKEDAFLHIYESVNDGTDLDALQWVNAKRLALPKSHGITPPWVLSPRLIPPPRVTHVCFEAMHNVRSPVDQSLWELVILNQNTRLENSVALTLPSGTSHRLELELPHHLTARPTFRFKRPQSAGSKLKVTYSEAYENTPHFVPYVRSKENRCDTTKLLIGPQDTYVFRGLTGADRDIDLHYTARAKEEETFTPFHFRTLRFMALEIHVCDESPLELLDIEMDMTHYPLDIHGGFEMPGSPEQNEEYQRMWTIGCRTLTNCMHDCYEDCPFYEQLQYAMDVRSSCLFTYAVSGDDRMARQAITQLHNSYRASVGLIASRSPAHQLQIIPHFSLFWICTVADHFEHAGDAPFARRFLSTIDGILESFARRIDPENGLVAADVGTHWDFVDWTDEWRPMGIPKAAARTGFQTFTNMLYAYTLRGAAAMLWSLGRAALAGEYDTRADSIIEAVRTYCRLQIDDDHSQALFTDGLAASADMSQDLSEHNQVWAVLSGTVTGDEARELLARCFPVPSTGAKKNATKLTRASTAMSFYTLRALSAVCGTLYDELFHDFWAPWRSQMAQGLTTWCEDDVTQRSDCHAWSCAMLYEFMAEVAGVRPGEPGWKSIVWKPRVDLLRCFRGRVPLGGSLAPSIAHVFWERELGDPATSLSMELRGVGTGDVPIRVEFPDGRVEEFRGTTLSLRITAEV